MHSFTQLGSDTRKNFGNVVNLAVCKIISLLIPPGSPIDIAIG